MKKAKGLSRLLVFTLAIVFTLTTMAGCVVKKDDQSGITPPQQVTTATKPAPTKLSLLWIEEAGANNINKYKPYNEVLKEIQKITNTEIEFLGMSAEKLNMTIAGGDLPDMVCTTDAVTTQLVNAKMIVELTSLLESNGKGILSDAPNRIATAKSKFDGKIYFLTPNAFGPDAPLIPGIQQSVYPYMRWDYYKELGYPAIKSYDDLLDVLKQMVEKHPTTENGKKVYAIGSWNDWPDFWFYNMLGLTSSSETVANSNASYYKFTTDETIRSNLLETDSQMWKTVLFMNKAHRMGILHPDSFTMKNADYEASMIRGELIFAPANWPVQKLNAELLKEGTAFMAIPMDFGYTYSNIQTLNKPTGYLGGAGFAGKNWSITTNCKTPEIAMDFLEFCYSKEGSRMLSSGLEGVHWDYVNGKPQMKESVVKAKMEAGEEWQKLCLFGSVGNMVNLIGLSGNVSVGDGGPVNLMADPSAYPMMLNPVEKEFSEHYGVTYPTEAFVKKVQQGLLQHRQNLQRGVALPAIPEDIKRINLKCEDIINKNLAKAILEPKTDAEFTKVMNDIISELKSAEAEKSWNWANEAWSAARAAKYNN